MCKKCKKAFRKDMTEYEEADEYCPNCDNQYVRLPPFATLGLSVLFYDRGRGRICDATEPSLASTCRIIAAHGIKCKNKLKV